MSGLEIAGLVLGLYPLIVSALEHYRHVHKAAGLLARFESEYRKVLDDAKDEQLIFRLTLEELLLPLTTNQSFNEGDLEALLSDLSHPNWNDENLQHALRERLGSTHDRFIEIVDSLHSLLSQLLLTLVKDKPELQARIKKSTVEGTTDAQTKVNRLSSASLQAFLKRQWHYRKEQVQFSFGERYREQTLKNIHKYNKKLDALLVKSEKVANFRQSNTTVASPVAVKSLLQYWQHANRLYTFIHHSWGCQCKGQHCAHLWLQHRTSPTFEFKLLLLWAPKMFLGQQFPPWDRQGLSITSRSLKDGATDSQTTNHTDSQVPACSTLVSVRSQPSKKRRVAFAGLLTGSTPSMTSTAELSRSAALPGAELEGKKDAEMSAELSKLCDKMSSSGMQSACIGSFNDHEAGRQYSVFSQPEQKIVGDEITLQEVLHGPRKRELKRSDRFKIALAVASSHLQLHSTPWASRQWEAADIRFPVEIEEKAGIMFDKPFVSTDFNATLPAEERSPKKTDKSFACLGIMLLELLFGICLEDHNLWLTLGQENKANIIFRLMVARQWADEVEDEAGEEYSSAVMWCLNESPTSLDGDKWRRDLADRVVLPIQKCCEWIKARPPWGI